MRCRGALGSGWAKVHLLFSLTHLLRPSPTHGLPHSLAPSQPQTKLVDASGWEKNTALAAGSLTGALLAGVITHPMDTIKSCMQVQYQPHHEFPLPPYATSN